MLYIVGDSTVINLLST